MKHRIWPWALAILLSACFRGRSSREIDHPFRELGIVDEDVVDDV